MPLIWQRLEGLCQDLNRPRGGKVCNHLTREVITSKEQLMTKAAMWPSDDDAPPPTWIPVATTDSSPFSVLFIVPVAPTISPTSSRPLTRSNPPAWASSRRARSMYSYRCTQEPGGSGLEISTCIISCSTCCTSVAPYFCTSTPVSAPCRPARSGRRASP